MKISLYICFFIASIISCFAKEKMVNPFDKESFIQSADQEKTPSGKNAFPSEPMLKTYGENIIVNQDILNDQLFKECLQLVEYMYFGTKRYASTKRIYEDAFRQSGPNRPALYQTIKNNGITIATSFFGTNGGKEGTDIGLIAYRKLNDKKILQLFVILEGSQGEDFEFLGGIGGASWLTNFKAKKVTTNAREEFELNEKYLLKGNGILSFHEGYLDKITTSNHFFKNALHSVLEDTLKIKSKAKKLKQTQEGLNLKNAIDAKRGFTVQVYILGHSQGGGLVQVAAPFYTTYIGQYLYGPNFDNEIFNTVHAICLSPARAIGDKYTLNVIQRVMGKGNIFGYCSPMDPVPCVPLGSNIDKHKMAGISFKLLKTLAWILSHFVNKDLSTLLDTISSVQCHYEDLPIFAYEDYNHLLKEYTKLSQEVLKESNGTSEQLKTLENIIKNQDYIQKHLKETQENYFKSHIKNIIKRKYYTAKVILHIKKVFKKCPIGDYLASQHLGTSACLKWKDYQGNEQKGFYQLFNHKILEGNVQKAIDRGIEYKKHKESFYK